MTETPQVIYEDMSCETCGGTLALLPMSGGAGVEIFCQSCGSKAVIMTTQCRGTDGGRQCNARLFFGGKSGRVPINIATGASHFLDCEFRAKFTRQRVGRKPAEGHRAEQGAFSV